MPGSALDTTVERQSDGDGARCGEGRKAAETAAGGRKEERRDTAPCSAAARAAMAGACSYPRAPLNRASVALRSARMAAAAAAAGELH